MNRLAWIATLIAIATLSAGSALAQGGRHGPRCDDDYRRGSRQGDDYRGSDRADRGHRDQRGRGVANSLETQVDRFARSFDHALDHSRLNGTRREDQLNEHAKRLERLTDQLRDRQRRGHGRGESELVQRIFEEARVLDRFIQRARLDRRAEQDWRSVTRDLDRLARQYRVARWQRDQDHRNRDRYRDDRRRRYRG